MRHVWLMILFFHRSLSDAKTFTLEGSGSVVAAPGSDVTLLCSINPPIDAVDMEVKWIRTDVNNRAVHHYKNKQDETDQDPEYRGRTELFKEKLQWGNTSLLLKNVKVSDGGQYMCCVDSPYWPATFNVLLKIEAIGTLPVISVLGTGASGGVLLQCESQGWWPVPELQWLNSEGVEQSPENKELCGDAKDSNVRSLLTAHRNSTNIITCRVKLGQHVKEKTIDFTEYVLQTGTGQHRETAIIVTSIVLILFLGLILGVFIFLRKVIIPKKEREKQQHKEVLQCLHQGGNGRLREKNFSDYQWKCIQHILLTSEEDLEEFDLNKYDQSEECFLKLQAVFCSCRKAKLRYCKLTKKSFEALGSALRYNHSLKELDLQGSNPEDSGVKHLCTGLTTSKCKLERLWLSNCSITEQGCAELVSVLERNASHLKELDLSGNKLKDLGVRHLCSVLQKSECKLEKLWLYHCSITDDGCAALALALQYNPSHLRELNLDNNSPGDSGVKELSVLLENLNCELANLQLSDCRITEEGCAALASALQKNPSHLRELDLTGSTPGDLGVKQLSALLANKQCNLEKLSLSCCSIKEKGCGDLALALQNNPSHLRDLDLSENTMGDSGVEQLSDVLKNPLCKLEKLWLSACSITQGGFVALTSAIQNNPSHLRELVLNNNKPGDSGVEHLSVLLENQQCKLEKLLLYNCCITDAGRLYLAKALYKNPSAPLEELNLSNSEPTDLGGKMLNDIRIYTKRKLKIWL